MIQWLRSKLILIIVHAFCKILQRFPRSNLINLNQGNAIRRATMLSHALVELINDAIAIAAAFSPLRRREADKLVVGHMISALGDAMRNITMHRPRAKWAGLGAQSLALLLKFFRRHG